MVATPEQHAAGTAEPVTPAGLQVRQVLDTDGDAVLFTASGEDPAVTGLWLWRPAGLTPLTTINGLGSGGGPGAAR
ncbi:MAG: hypothetical protein ACRDRJ_15775 [Streptosporangiaceae bacterium]